MEKRYKNKNKPEGQLNNVEVLQNRSSNSSQILQLQRTIGNRAVQQLIQKRNALETTENVIQPKRLKSDIKNIGSGHAGQWHDGDPNFHVTIYSDDNDYNPRGHEFVSDKFASEFHVTKYSGTTVLGRRFYDIDSGAKIGADQGTVDDSFNELAGKFMLHISNAKIYSDKEAQTYEDVITSKEDEEKLGIDQKVKGIITKYISENDFDVNKPSAMIHIGRIRNIIRDQVKGHEITSSKLEELVKTYKAEQVKEDDGEERKTK
ncbi:hypothetical protein A8709_29795 [Paenibacillus pectinilyticus]|uniref:Uncharacterized protein n=1 Tax=Paenibacillus pectinilyticus TaxID=512399 RepID=A0A1C0ZVC9_9BACL|nr:hypothetical protein A8709_29795 [Paenibacillus pectinilyticus]